MVSVGTAVEDALRIVRVAVAAEAPGERRAQRVGDVDHVQAAGARIRPDEVGVGRVLVEDDVVSFYVNEGVGCTEIDRHVGGEKAEQS